MTKELEALNVLYQISLNTNIHYQKKNKDTDDYKGRIEYHKNIVETALKRLENHEQNEDFNKDVLNYAFLSEQDKIKKLKALETLKNELGFDRQSFFVEVDEKGNKKYYFEGREIAKEKYELLKEVLLWNILERKIIE